MTAEGVPCPTCKVPEGVSCERGPNIRAEVESNRRRLERTIASATERAKEARRAGLGPVVASARRQAREAAAALKALRVPPHVARQDAARLRAGLR